LEPSQRYPIVPITSVPRRTFQGSVIGWLTRTRKIPATVRGSVDPGETGEEKAAICQRGSSGGAELLSAIRPPDVIKLLTNLLYPSYSALQATFYSAFLLPDTQLNLPPTKINRHGQCAHHRRDTRPRRRARQFLRQRHCQHRLRNHSISRRAQPRETS